MLNKLAVLGQPIAHSLSPAMHTAAFAELGLAEQWSYGAIEVSPEQFAGRVRAMPGEGYVGANVTIPHKQAALAIADTASEATRAVGAANTLSFADGAIHADNTDAPGLIAALPADPSGLAALVLGAGGSARAVVWALHEAGAEVSVWNRTAARAAGLAEEFGVSAVEAGEPASPGTFDLVVNCTAIGLERAGTCTVSSSGHSTFKDFGFGVDQFNDRQVVVDLVYGSTETGLVRAAKGRGAKTIDGLEILVRQGAESLRLWTGLEPPLATMRREVQSRRHT